jgi:hypothetical protein
LYHAPADLRALPVSISLGESEKGRAVAATILTILLLLAALVAAALLARRLKTAPSIVLVIAGIALALVPGLPRIELAPELVLLGILPPLIYQAGVSMSCANFASICARSHCSPSVASSLPPAPWRRLRICCSDCRGQSDLFSAPSSLRRTWWRRSRSPGG